jgi:hypothetical protein
MIKLRLKIGNEEVERELIAYNQLMEVSGGSQWSSRRSLTTPGPLSPPTPTTRAIENVLLEWESGRSPGNHCPKLVLMTLLLAPSMREEAWPPRQTWMEEVQEDCPPPTDPHSDGKAVQAPLLQNCLCISMVCKSLVSPR